MPYTATGESVAGGPHTYPEMAAAGLWTTPTDLAKYIIEVQQSLQGKANHVLSQSMTEQMLTPGKGHWGLGVEVGGSAADPWFPHGGSNVGYESLFVAYEHNGDGAAVMTNAQRGGRLASEVLSAIAVSYNWPDHKPAVRTQIKLDPAVLRRYIGTYEVSPAFSVAVTLKDDHLLAQPTAQPGFAMFPESQTKFFLKEVPAEVEFFSNSGGQVTHIVIHMRGQVTKGIQK